MSAIMSRKNQNTKDSTDSPMRSLNSFKDEIPGGDFPPTKEDDDNISNKSFQTSVQGVMNSAPFHITILLLVFVHCLLLTAEIVITIPGVNDSSNSTVTALAITCLAILTFFILEVTLRIFSTGFVLLKKRLELFDILVVLTTFTLDVIFFAVKLHNDNDWTRGLTYLILLRCWRFYGVYYDEVKKIRNDMHTDIEMAKYGRRQAETQADALQSQRDAQLKEIFYLREYLHEHDLDPDSYMRQSHQVQSSPSSSYSNQPGYSRTVSIDRAETMREETRLYPAYSEESALSSIDDYKHHEVQKELPDNETDGPALQPKVTSPSQNNCEERSHDTEGSDYDSPQEDSQSGNWKDSAEQLESNLGDGMPSANSHQVVEPNKDVKPVNNVEGLQEEGRKEGIDNPAFEDEVSTADRDADRLKETTPKGSPSKKDRSRLGSDLECVTEDVNGVPMTTL